MDYYWVIYAASCFLSYFIGSRLGAIAGFDMGKTYMKALIIRDMKKYPTKWKWYIEHGTFDKE